MFNDYPDVVTVDDLQKMLRLGRSAAYSLLKSGKIKTLKFGKKYIIPKTSVIDFLNSDLWSQIKIPWNSRLLHATMQ